MFGQKMNSVLKSGVLGLMLFAAPSLTIAVDVSDSAGFFSADALEKANAAIREIEKKSGHDIRIETHATVATDKVDAVAKMDKTQRESFMRNWAKDRAKAVKENGSLILICKDPGRVETWFSGKLKDAGFGASDRELVTKAMMDGFKTKNYDGALSDTVTKFSESYSKLKPATAKTSAVPHNPVKRAPDNRVNHAPATLHQNAQAVQGQPNGQAQLNGQGQSGWITVVFVVGMVLAGIFIISMLARLIGGGGRGAVGGGGYGQPGYGGGGGGFMSSLAGGIFGAVAGNWLYDAFSGHSAHAHDSTNTNSDPLSGSSSLGDDVSSSSDGGWTDEGSSSGGGWFDGGSGGGDSGGGGDFGGGSGDFGGGGDF